jgi:hypothetical protein
MQAPSSLFVVTREENETVEVAKSGRKRSFSPTQAHSEAQFSGLLSDQEVPPVRQQKVCRRDIESHVTAGKKKKGTSTPSRGLKQKKAPQEEEDTPSGSISRRTELAGTSSVTQASVTIQLIPMYPCVISMEDAKYAGIDRHALDCPASLGTLEQIAAYLASWLPNREVIVRAVFTWVAANIEFDIEGANAGAGPAKSVEEILRSKKAVSGGYASIFVALCVAAGIPPKDVIKIPGHSKGTGWSTPPLDIEKCNHGWNAVRIKNRWRLVDCTWAAGYVADNSTFVRDFDSTWFFPSPVYFLYDHFPKDPQWQLTSTIVPWELWLQLPKIRPAFLEYKLQWLECYNNCHVRKTNKPYETIEIGTPAEVRILANLYYLTNDNKEMIDHGGIHIQTSISPYSQKQLLATITCRFNQGNGKYKAVLFATTNHNTNKDAKSVCNFYFEVI